MKKIYILLLILLVALFAMSVSAQEEPVSGGTLRVNDNHSRPPDFQGSGYRNTA